jgi:hypothetical protein
MKRIYLLLFSVFVAGGLAAQSKTVVKQTKATMSAETSVTDSRTNTTTHASLSAASGVKETNTDPTAALPGFPVYQNTGNKEVDDANYSIAKENWINENRAMYDEYMLKTKQTEGSNNNEANQPK